ncbi:MAG: YihA family ribosome biogenesis GTP-binding protein [Chitinophagales bacterium]|nr:YihA family ribosome biogenesis GTP-binding protein [Chitinophagales bacterium]
MQIKSAEYTISQVDVEKCPTPEIPEFAFIGRSNVGKSSLINYLCGRKKLSKVSNTPGKTQTINYFDINGSINFVDLPGYSFAKVSIEMRNKWNNMIRNYILKREQLMYVFQLIDSRVPPQKVDLDFIGWMGKNHVPLVVIFTKADKPGSKEATSNIQAFKNALLKEWEELPIIFVTSSEKKVGGEQVLNFIDLAAKSYYSEKKRSIEAERKEQEEE